MLFLRFTSWKSMKSDLTLMRGNLKVCRNTLYLYVYSIVHDNLPFALDRRHVLGPLQHDQHQNRCQPRL